MQAITFTAKLNIAANTGGTVSGLGYNGSDAQ